MLFMVRGPAVGLLQRGVLQLLLGLFCLGWPAVAAASDCRVSVVGGGWAGVYAAWRVAVDARVVEGRHVCLFEARHAIGGRTYSVNVEVDQEQSLVVDVGAYRFSKDQHLPADLIKHLNLSSQCYKPSCSSEEGMTLYRIVDAVGDSVGYGVPMEIMHQQLLAAGVRVVYGAELQSILPAQGANALSLKLSDTEAVAAETVLLNLPRAAMLRLSEGSVIFEDPLSRQLFRNCTPLTSMSLKVYVIYPEPWWVTKLSLPEGYFNDSSEQPPFVGRYHDGAMNRLPGGELGASALEVVYNFYNDTSLDWYKQYRTNQSDVLTITDNAEMLLQIHERLMKVHASRFAAKGISSSTIARPTKAVMGFWDAIGVSLAAQYDGHPTPGNDKRNPRESCLNGVMPNEYISAVSDPTGGKHRVFVANNDFFWDGYSGSGCCWAENSLKPMEKLLHDSLGLVRPAWLDKEYYERDVLQYGVHSERAGVTAALLTVV